MLLLPIYNISLTEQISTATFHPFLSKDECQNIIDSYRVESPVVAKVADNGAGRRETLIHPIPQNEGSDNLYKSIADRVARANQFGYDFDISGLFGDLQLLEYGEGGKYDWHMDIGPGHAAHRKLSVIIQLSDPDDYEGGEVVFKASENEHTLPRDRGMIAIFPSYVLHKVNPVTKGTRYSLVTWAFSHRRFR
jgi:PKHD-type hydroxylase